MVRAVDIEGLFKKYLEDRRFECADALYLAVKLGRKRAADTLALRYKMAGPLTSALEDLRQLGVNVDSWDWGVTEDTKEHVKDVITRTFERMCLDEFIEEVGKKAKDLSPLAKEILFLISRLGEEVFRRLYISELLKLHELIFQRRVNEKSWRRAFEELVAAGILQSTERDYAIPTFFDILLLRLERFLPKIEVRVEWPKTE